ncbi:MAG: LysM repeat-containing protein [Verrucomicrobia bacterium]|jgi:hypothetical protein|nr:MAG: LysM repeat-containing protein [Verrucomicrobiota bacterium]
MSRIILSILCGSAACVFTSCVGLNPRPGAQADPYAANGVAGPYNNYTPPAQTSPPAAQDPYAAGQYSQGGYNQGGYGTAPVADSGSSGGGYSGGGAAGGARSHTVAPGENLTKISRTYNVSIDALVRANNLSSPDQIRSGQKLAIP